MNLVSLLSTRARLHPDRPALISAQRTVSFQQLEQEVAGCAYRLTESGIAAGDKIVVLVPFSIDLYIALLSLMRVSAVAVFTDPGFTKQQFASCMKTAEPKAAICLVRTYPLLFLAPSLRRLPLWLSLSTLPLPKTKPIAPLSGTRSHPPSETDGSAAALLTFTSGSTGKPKGVVRSHEFLLEQHRVLQHHLQHAEGERELTTLPIFGIANIASGVTTVIPNASMKRPGNVHASPILEQIRINAINRVVASPAFLERLVECIEADKREIPQLTRIYTGGAPVFPQLLKRLAKAAPNARVEAVYGSTEAEPIAHISTEELTAEDLRHTASGGGLLAGPPIREIGCRVIAASWGTPVGPFTEREFADHQKNVNEVGEIVVNGRHVLRGYLNGAGDEETKFYVAGECWHRTGDLGYFDSYSRLWLVGRAAAAVLRSGDSPLYPFCVECAAQTHRAVRRAALAMIDDSAILALETCFKSPSIMSEVSALVSWAHLDRLVVIDAIPLDRRHNAKVDYPRLQQLLRAKRHRCR